jgi:hypothetical protein
VEIRTLGFRLRSIPAGQSEEYAVDRWNPIGGYGIRGIGGRRACLCGVRGAGIETTDGEAMVHDLQVMKQAAS